MVHAWEEEGFPQLLYITLETCEALATLPAHQKATFATCDCRPTGCCYTARLQVFLLNLRRCLWPTTSTFLAASHTTHPGRLLSILARAS